MLYRTDRYGNQLSELGFGCMRWTKSGGSVDLEKAEKEVLRAAELGVNYFDTAYIRETRPRSAPFWRGIPACGTALT